MSLHLQSVMRVFTGAAYADGVVVAVGVRRRGRRTGSLGVKRRVTISYGRRVRPDDIAVLFDWA